MKNDFEQAIADYSEAIRVDPKYALANSNRVLAQQRKRADR